MRILHCVESYNPSVGGMQEVVKQLSERLVLAGHDVTVLTRFDEKRNFTVLNGVKIVQFKITGNPGKVETLEEQRYVDFLINTPCDIVTFFAAQQWATDLALPYLKNIRAKKVSVPTGYSGLYWPEFKSYFEKMKTYIHDYDMNVYLSDDYRDINFARENEVKHISIIPNGAAADEFLPETKIDVRKELKIKKSDFLILHVGSFTGKKGHIEAIELFFRSKINNSTLLMIGNGSENFSRYYVRHPLFTLKILFKRLFENKRIIFRFFPRNFTVAAYKQSDLFLFPSNIECSPIVLFECAAAKLPFLSTDVGNAAEIAMWTKGGEILPTEKDSEGISHVKVKEAVLKLNRLFDDIKKRKEMGEQSYNIWVEKYSWEKIAKQYEAMYAALLTNK